MVATFLHRVKSDTVAVSKDLRRAYVCKGDVSHMVTCIEYVMYNASKGNFIPLLLYIEVSVNPRTTPVGAEFE